MFLLDRTCACVPEESVFIFLKDSNLQSQMYFYCSRKCFSFLKQQCNWDNKMEEQILWRHFLACNVSNSHVPEDLANATSLSCKFHVAKSESALNFGAGTSVRLILFFNSSHRHTRTASSYCKLHFPRETAASPKAKQNVITQEFKKYQKVWVLLQKSSVSTNKCGAQTCFIIEMADGPIMGRTAVRRDCGKQSVHSDHDPSFLLLQQGDRVWSWNPQNSNRTHYCCSSETRTDRPIHSFKSGMFIHFIVIVVFLLCIFSLGTKPCSYWPRRDEILGNNWLKCNICTEINSKQIGNDLLSKHSRKCLSLGSLQFLEFHWFNCYTWFELYASNCF